MGFDEVKRKIKDKIVDTINKFKEIGFFDHLSEKDFLKAKKKAIKSRRNSFWLLEEFPNTIYWFDTEIEVEKPYKFHTINLSKISHGKFKPKNIIDIYNPDTATEKFGFELDKDKYETEIDDIEDWIDTSFVDLINESITEHMYF